MKIARHLGTNQEALLFLAFENRTLQHGGRHRSEQLEEIFAGAGWTLEDLPDLRPGQRLLTLLWGIAACLRVFFFRPFGIETLRGAGVEYYRLTRTLRAHPRIKVLVVEGTGGTSLLMVPIARRHGIRVLVVPQNIESLAPYDWFTHRLEKSARFRQETRLLQRVDGAFCISTEEEWLLRLFDVPAFYLPYRPPREIAQRLLALRERRRASVKSGFLVLGTASNQPTLKGLRALYRMLTQEMSDLPVTIHIAGRDTETLRGEFSDPRVVLHGTVSDAALDELMVQATGLLVMQAPTTGFLTRVVEACYAGVPIIGNADAVKGWRELSGVHAFYRAGDLERLLAAPLSEPAVPPAPSTEIGGFQRALQALDLGL
ncbi:MAG: glycosyltransferase [Rhodospirillales bacterium]|nr:glycosyltransferase [Acetobacter sp.]